MHRHDLTARPIHISTTPTHMARSSDGDTGNPTAERVIVNIDGLEELTAIREALSGIRDDIAWWINNHRGNGWLPIQSSAIKTGMPAHDDPSNDVRPTTRGCVGMPTPAPYPQTPAVPCDSRDEETQFCCEAPDLQWTGDPQFPGVACMNCGYMVADCGSVVMQPSPEADPEPKEQQRDLFAEQ